MHARRGRSKRRMGDLIHMGRPWRIRPAKSRAAIVLLLSSLMVGCACAVSSCRLSGEERELVIAAGYDTRPVLRERVAPGSEFVLKYAHSQTGGPMEMRFKIGRDCKIVLSEVRAKILRPEIEELAEYAREVVREDGWTVYKGMDQEMDPLIMRVRVSSGQQSLVLNGSEIALRSLGEPGTRLEFRVR